MKKDRKLLIGCVADDFTGATDVAGIFAKSGMKTTVLINVPMTNLKSMPTRSWWLSRRGPSIRPTPSRNHSRP
ncbi:four-carbon acid sugar kinase family protein [Ensifer aridi]|uniref:four-carbon acid sugar kinase family protein n=1 Tax=Ensifer aridi TaxID=1708715 RepID=UPI0023B9F1B8|nr:four-carbon acid sugar kinase family protein [Ensifer aridi]